MSYHTLKIPKVSHTSPFKIHEEFLEYIDALLHKNKIMAATELSDLFLCIKSEALKLGFSTQDLEIMANKTKEVFETNSRPSFNLFNYLKNNGQYFIRKGNCVLVVLDNIVYYITKDSLTELAEPCMFEKEAMLEVLDGIPIINKKACFKNDLQIVSQVDLRMFQNKGVFRVIHESANDLNHLKYFDKFPITDLEEFSE